jgi:hypothetical protein
MTMSMRRPLGEPANYRSPEPHSLLLSPTEGPVFSLVA